MTFVLVASLMLAVLAVLGQGEGFLDSANTQEVPLSTLQSEYSAGNLASIEVKDTTLTAEAIDGTKYRSTKEPDANIADLGFNDIQQSTEVEIIDTTGSKLLLNFLFSLLPILLIIGLFVYFTRRASGGAGGEYGPFGFGKSRAKVYEADKHKTTFADVAGAQEAKEEVTEIVDFLKHPKRYYDMGAKIPRGILMVGQPGTGKTLLARAIAGEASVPFFSVSGSEFVEMFVGVGASRVRDLFKQAQRNAPAIIFIDEIDAIGKQRGQGSGGGHDEREQTLNQILTEMDGFDDQSGVIVIAATNRPDVLDKALLRPGRFDRRVHIDMPDMVARRQILDVHANNKKFTPDINLDKIASKTVGFSGADLENVLNEAAIMAVRQREKKISQAHLEDAVEKVSMGPERRSRKITDKEREIVAYHEVGHALAGHFAAECEPVHKISIISRGGALGLTWFLPEEDTYLRSEQKLKDEMVSLHGGRIAEELIFGQTTTGASNDLERITKIARSMVMTYGMGGQEVGPVVFSEKSRSFAGIEFHESDVSPDTARTIDLQVRRLVLEAETRCRDILTQHMALLKQISVDLLDRENIFREEFLAYFDSPTPA